MVNIHLTQNLVFHQRYLQITSMVSEILFTNIEQNKFKHIFSIKKSLCIKQKICHLKGKRMKKCQNHIHFRTKIFKMTRNHSYMYILYNDGNE